MKRIIALILLLATAMLTTSCYKYDAVSDEVRTHEIASDVHSLYISINAADFRIERADKLSVESNLKYLSVSNDSGVLSVVDEARPHSRYTGATLTLFLPSDTVFDSVSIETGASKMTVGSLSANYLDLKLGAGDICFDTLNAYSEIKIRGGAGAVTVSGGTLNDLSLEMGVGELNLTAALMGESELEFGVGEANLTLIGGKDIYEIDIDKGIGNITVDGKSVSDFGSSGNGSNKVDVDGGVGAINIVFKDN